ncbi:hypothetical protein DFH07DRAFT_997690 [Mycena maculata]|uniref:Uncharacterized protein n=1 Tax=Mycena maculata TaxID=230809 RepID=A0AAD7NRB2_9AGAR|nr:hypothetical protein DFH07DRAFT_997690 [Mycena maculata]
MASMEPRPSPHKPYPWPWAQRSILTPEVEEKPSWLNTDLDEKDDSGDYIPSSDDSGSDDGNQGTESDEDSDSTSQVSDPEVADLTAHGLAWRRSPFLTESQQSQEQNEDLARQISELVKAEQDAAAAYNPEEVVSLITQFYELLITMGHWPEGSLRYSPHVDPPVNEALAAGVGYAPAVISLMKRLPYLTWKANRDDSRHIVGRTPWADYTSNEDIAEGRHPYPYQYIDGCPDLDPWLLPLMLPERDGWNVLLDTNLGAIRAYSTERSPPRNTVEWRRHGDVPDAEEAWTEYRRAPLVPAARYFSELVDAYRSLSRLPVITVDHNDPKEEPRPSYPAWLAKQIKEEQETVLTLYRECGWPDQWRRAEFVSKWEAAVEEIGARARAHQQGRAGKREKRGRRK